MFVDVWKCVLCIAAAVVITVVEMYQLLKAYVYHTTNSLYTHNSEMQSVYS